MSLEEDMVRVLGWMEVGEWSDIARAVTIATIRDTNLGTKTKTKHELIAWLQTIANLIRPYRVLSRRRAAQKHVVLTVIEASIWALEKTSDASSV